MLRPLGRQVGPSLPGVYVVLDYFKDCRSFGCKCPHKSASTRIQGFKLPPQTLVMTLGHLPEGRSSHSLICVPDALLRQQSLGTLVLQVPPSEHTGSPPPSLGQCPGGSGPALRARLLLAVLPPARCPQHPLQTLSPRTGECRMLTVGLPGVGVRVVEINEGCVQWECVALHLQKKNTQPMHHPAVGHCSLLNE